MRVQIYEEELDEDVTVVTKVSRNGEGFYGLRIWLKNSTLEGDDRSAVTFLGPLINQMFFATNGG